VDVVPLELKVPMFFLSERAEGELVSNTQLSSADVQNLFSSISAQIC